MEVPLKIVQTAAIAEVVHASIGIVRSPPLVTGECVRGESLELLKL